MAHYEMSALYFSIHFKKLKNQASDIVPIYNCFLQYTWINALCI